MTGLWIPGPGAEESLIDRAALARQLVWELEELLTLPLPGEEVPSWRSPAKAVFLSRLHGVRWRLREAQRQLSEADAAAQRLLAAGAGGG